MANLEKEDKLSGIKDLDGLIHSPARLAIMANLFVLKNADFTFLVNLTKLSWGNISTHVRKLEEAGYIEVEKTFVGRKPQTMLALSKKGRDAFLAYREQMQGIIEEVGE